MNARADKVEFNYIQYVLLDIKLAFFIIIFLLRWNFILSLHKIHVCLSCTLFFRSHRLQWNFNLEKNLAHFSLWFIILYSSKAIFVPDWIFAGRSEIWLGILYYEGLLPCSPASCYSPMPGHCSAWKDSIYHHFLRRGSCVNGWPQTHKLGQKWSKPFTPAS